MKRKITLINNKSLKFSITNTDKPTLIHKYIKVKPEQFFTLNKFLTDLDLIKHRYLKYHISGRITIQ